jgi:hypothetical protein
MTGSFKPTDGNVDGHDHPADRSGRAGREATRAYMCDILRDLSRMARRQGDMTLAYLIDMAELEAQSARQPPCRSKRQT